MIQLLCVSPLKSLALLVALPIPGRTAAAESGERRSLLVGTIGLLVFLSILILGGESFA